MLWLILVPIALYAVMVLWQWWGWRQLTTGIDSPTTSSLTVVVAARNEGGRIMHLIADLKAQRHGAFRAIIVNDHSTDGTRAEVLSAIGNDTRFRLLDLEGAEGKKSAIEAAIAQADSDLILCTDADCRMGPDHLHTMLAQFGLEGVRMVLGPVILSPAHNVFGTVQAMEMNAIMGVTGGMVRHGHPVMANGANILFRRDDFVGLGGYQGLKHNPSGDDVFLMLRIHRQYPGSVAFCRDFRAVVATAPKADVGEFFSQRRRWLSKRGSYTDSWVNITAMVTFLGNLAGLMCLFIIPINKELAFWGLMLKTVPDLMLVRAVQRDLEPRCGWGLLLLAELYMLIYVPLVGLLPAGRYVWKDRQIDLGTH